jgi:RNA polymerase sigma factor (sigma-70 family)
METSGERDAFVRRVSRGMCSGSEDAFRLFYEAYFDRIFRHLLVRARGDEDCARELTQQVFLRVARHGREFENEALLWAWLKQVARSCQVDWIRRNGQRSAATIELSDQTAAPAPDDAEDELRAALEEGLGALEIAERELIELSYFEALPHPSIARRLNTTAKAIESKLARVRQKLRKQIIDALKDYALL